MPNIGGELRAEIDSAGLALRAMTEAAAGTTFGSGTWTKKEILGHLIDSAVNNHQRFVRAQAADALVFPGYGQDDWVAAQRYRDRPWTELVDLWVTFNQPLAHVMDAVPESRYATRCVIGNNEPVTLEWLMRDYLRHLRHHLGQIRTS